MARRRWVTQQTVVKSRRYERGAGHKSVDEASNKALKENWQKALAQIEQ